MRSLVYISILILLSIGVLAQTPSYIFHNIGERSGLSSNYCYSVLKDSHGMMWIGTQSGLSRHDGVHFYNFNAGDDSTTFINNTIFDLCEDKNGNIWGATGSGIFCYKHKENKFVNYIPPTYDFARIVKNIICDRKGDIWATTEWNIQKFNKEKNIFEEVIPLTKEKDSLGVYSVRQNGLVEDPAGNGLWFATRSGIHFYNFGEQKYYNFKNQSGSSLFTNHGVAALSLSSSGHFWFFDNITKDIISFDPKTFKIIHRINMNSAIPGAFGQTLFEDSQGKLWFSSWNDKMAVIDYRKNIITSIAYKNDSPLSIAGDSFWDVWEDEDNNIWLGTAGGISKCNYTKNIYSIMPIVGNVPEFQNSNLESFTIDPRDKSWWFSSVGNRSVVRYFPWTGKYTYFDLTKALKNNLGQLPGPVYGVKFIDNQPYICTHTGVWQLQENKNQIIPFQKKFEGLPNLNYIFFDVNGDEVWFITAEGFIKWNSISNKAIIIKTPLDIFPDGQKPTYSQITFDKTGRPWYIPAFGWLAHINKKNEVVLKYYVKNKAKELSGYVTSMNSDNKGNMWLAASGIGLYRYHIASDEMKLFPHSSGISSFVNQTCTDNKERLWLAMRNKFAIFDPSTNSISHFKLPIHENTFNYGNVMVSDSNGEIMATVFKDIVKFTPDRLNLKPRLKEPLLSMIKISGKEKLINEETKLDLESYENSLEFNFGSLINNEIFPYTFDYQLEGFDSGWITANNFAVATYNNLSHGKYVFKVKAVANDKSWQTPEKIITLIIRTPFYKSVWFWALISSFVITGFLYFYRFRINKQKQILSLETKSQLLEKEKTMVMYDSLKQQLNPHFLFNSLTSLSGLIATDQSLAGSFLEQMSGIYRYILQNSENDTVTLKDEIKFVKLYVSLQRTRFSSGFEVNIHVPDDFIHHKIAPVTLQNLIENAIKHNIIDAESPLVIDIYLENDYIVVKNNLQKKNVVETSNKKGLAQFVTLYRYLSDKPIIVEESKESYTIKIPLI
ncbi:MAG: histidine kinase [Saprospiraceae bacterium]